MIQFVLCIACLYMAISLSYKHDLDAIYFMALFFLTLDNLIKSDRIAKLSIAVLEMHNKIPEEFDDYDINVEIKRR